jgi:microcystin-dependent protein
MNTVIRVALGSLALTLTTFALVASADERPYLGEVRAIAMAKGNHDLVTRLHHDGWLEANGQILSVEQFEDLYHQLGRAWTADAVPQDRFALPRLRDTTQPLPSSSDPYGVLSPGTLAPNRPRRQPRQMPLSYWIFVGQDVDRVTQVTDH